MKKLLETRYLLGPSALCRNSTSRNRTWTGTLAASILDWDFKRSVLAVMLGVILAGIIMGTLSLLFGVDTLAH